MLFIAEVIVYMNNTTEALELQANNGDIWWSAKPIEPKHKIQ